MTVRGASKKAVFELNVLYKKSDRHLKFGKDQCVPRDSLDELPNPLRCGDEDCMLLCSTTGSPSQARPFQNVQNSTCWHWHNEVVEPPLRIKSTTVVFQQENKA